MDISNTTYRDVVLLNGINPRTLPCKNVLIRTAKKMLEDAKKVLPLQEAHVPGS